MKVVVAGSSGMIGRALVAALRRDGHEVSRLVRRAAAAPDEYTWDPAHAQLDERALRGADAAVNLCGVSIGGGPGGGGGQHGQSGSPPTPPPVPVCGARVARLGGPAPHRARPGGGPPAGGPSAVV
ncbi:NAD-dependent epimerase/dehydratase family protein, partial [Nocardia neocaledoniensis]|uniref:NAD-dependent epimerase/dehydratase family protein n=1 Tax=Nocardia neocaledoniensis TaxID=236511 RepID=UPI00245764AB